MPRSLSTKLRSAQRASRSIIASILLLAALLSPLGGAFIFPAASSAAAPHSAKTAKAHTKAKKPVARHKRTRKRIAAHATAATRKKTTTKHVRASKKAAGSKPAGTTPTPSKLAPSGTKSAPVVKSAPVSSAPSRPAPGSSGSIATISGASAWSEPSLVNPTVVALSDSNRNLKLNQAQDYILRCPSGPMPLTWPVVVWGGHNVVLQNCDIDVTVANWAGQFKDQTGTLWIDDVHFGGSQLTGGIQLQEPGATVVMRDVLFDTVSGSYTTNHAECVQTWSGPARFLIDGLTCSTTYQGLFLLPNQYDSTTTETAWDFRNINIAATGAYALWLGDVGTNWSTTEVSIPTWSLQNIYVSGPGEPRNMDYSGFAGMAWNNVTAGTPPGGSFVTATADGATGVDDGAQVGAFTGEQAGS